jgi:hypothetical protein
MARKKLTPEERIARVITEDIGSSNGVNESLYGHQIQPGDTPVDRLVSHVDQAYMDWDINDTKFQQLTQKLLGKIPSEQEWTSAIMMSKQNPELKKKLLQGVGVSSSAIQAMVQSTPQPSSQPTGGGGGGGAAGSGQRSSVRVGGFKARLNLHGQGKSGVVHFNRGTKIQLVNIRQHPNNKNVFVGEYASGPSTGMSITFNRKNVSQIV